MNPGRWLRHLFTGHGAVRRAFPDATLDAIERTIRETEAAHSGQIRVVIEASLDGPRLWADETARERAVEVFSLMRVWDTEHNNGVLIYLLMADRDVEIIADRGIHAKCGADAWEAVCREMEQHFRAGTFEAGALAGVRAIGDHLTRHFPGRGAQGNEMPDRPVVL
ncbi:MAG: TPM domain-containing protein [Betaproteobacteria bacterium]